MSENRESERTGIVFVISGPSGSGKGTVVDLLRTLCPDMGLSVSATTREKRDYEQEGVNYYFKTREQFEKMIAGGFSNTRSTTAISTARRRASSIA